MREFEFEVEIARPGSFGANTSTVLGLPATWAEYQDALQKARITDDRVIYSSELCDIKREYLQPHIKANADLLELNLLAQRLAGLDWGQSKRLEALVRIEEKQGGNDPIPLPRLINLTHSTDRCQEAPGVRTDEALGKFLHENDMLSETDSRMVGLKTWESRYSDEFFAILGKKHRESENGVFTGTGYVESGGINEVYAPGNTVYFHRSGFPVVLEISKGRFNDLGCDNNLTASLDLPAGENQIGGAVEKVEAASLKEIGYSCVDCLIPAAKEWIDDIEDVSVVNEFAKALAYLERRGMVTQYKALLEAAECSDMYTAAALAYDADAYVLYSEIAGPEDCARDYLSRLKSREGCIDLVEFMNLHKLGVKVMERDNAADTAYGVLRRYDGGPIQVPEHESSGPVMGQ